MANRKFNKRYITGILIIALVFGILVVGCNDGIASGTDSILNGIWAELGVYYAWELKLNNGNFQVSMPGGVSGKGNYTANNSSITFTATQIYGPFHSTFDHEHSKWYTKADCKALGASDAELNEIFGPSTGTYSIGGNKLAITNWKLFGTYEEVWLYKRSGDDKFEVKTRIPLGGGSTLEFSEKPVRAQWGIVDHTMAFVFPKGTIIRGENSGYLYPIYAINEYAFLDSSLPREKYYQKDATELTLTSEMGKAAYGIRIGADLFNYNWAIYWGRTIVYIEGLTDRAVNPGDSIIYVWDIDPSIPIPTDDKTLAKYRLPSKIIQSDDPEITALAEKITKGIYNDYQKAKAIHLWVAGNIWYDYDYYNTPQEERSFGDDQFNRYSTLVLESKSGVCEGYSRLTVALLRAAGISAIYTQGNTNIGYHAWNQAYANNRWINMDTTWDSKNRYENGKFSPKQDPGSAWFDVPDKEFSKTHVKYGYFGDYIIKNKLAATEVR